MAGRAHEVAACDFMPCERDAYGFPITPDGFERIDSDFATPHDWVAWKQARGNKSPYWHKGANGSKRGVWAIRPLGETVSGRTE